MNEFYVVRPQAFLNTEEKPISFDDIISGYEFNEVKRRVDLTGTFTVRTNRSKYSRGQMANIRSSLDLWLNKTEALRRIEDRHSMYREFKIPKHSGGWRTINAPNQELSTALTELKDIIENLIGTIYHTAAFAYVGGRIEFDNATHKTARIKGRTAADAVRRHQRNNSNYILKTDFSDFFGSTNKKFAMDMVMKVDPFASMSRQFVERVFDLCFLDDKLPQGTPVSPKSLGLWGV